MSAPAIEEKKTFLTPPVRLNLGCNRRAEEGWINVDMERFRGVNVVTDLNERWPWDDNSVDEIKAYDLVEHLPDAVHTMNEAWRVLKEGGVFNILVPSTDGRGAFQDPTHKSFWNENSWHYYRVYPDEEGKIVSHAWRRLYAPHYIKAAFEIADDTGPPSEDGIIYCFARCTKRQDPGDCEAPETNGDT